MRQRSGGSRSILAGTAAAAAILLIAGCGGGSGGSSPTRSAPTATTRSHVQSLTQMGLRSLTQSGVQTASLAASRNGLFATGAPVASGGVASPAAHAIALPMVGAFLKNVAAAPPAMRAARISRMVAAHAASGRGIAEPGPLPPVPAPTFYYDNYLGLWVQVADGTDSSSYLLYQDEAKTEPAGSIVTKWPADWNVYPQIYSSTYSFTAGFLSGSHGDSLDTTNADGSGSSSYEDTYSDGGSDKGSSTWGADGSSAWSSRADNADGSWYECSGSFAADGSGKTHEKSSDGYAADYVYNADGSGSAVISGPDPGLPAKIVWDVYGNETITWADGTVETIPIWYGYADGGPVGTVGSSGGGSGESGGGVASPGATPPAGSTAPPPATGNG